MSDASTFAWNDGFKSGHPGMDATHQDSVALVHAAARAVPADVDPLLERLERHCTAHFEEERELMVRHAFPAAECHVAEHAAVLASIGEVRALHDRAHRCVTTQRLAHSLAEWFEGHLAHLDSALAQWVVRCTHGGTPVVFRRNEARASGPGEAVEVLTSSR